MRRSLVEIRIRRAAYPRRTAYLRRVACSRSRGHDLHPVSFRQGRLGADSDWTGVGWNPTTGLCMPWSSTSPKPSPSPPPDSPMPESSPTTNPWAAPGGPQQSSPTRPTIPCDPLPPDEMMDVACHCDVSSWRPLPYGVTIPFGNPAAFVLPQRGNIESCCVRESCRVW